MVFVVVPDLCRSQSAREIREGRRGTHVVCKDVKPPIIRIRLLTQPVPHIMFRDEMARERMQAPGEETAHYQVHQHVLSAWDGVEEEGVEGELGEDADGVPGCGLLRTDEARAEGVEEDLEGAVCARIC